jgi:hypothetical protein
VKPSTGSYAEVLLHPYVTPVDYLELIARQTSASTKNVAADALSWFAIEVVE